jgi:hypothetical protein
LQTPTRNAYWYGKRLTEYHMNLEQSYGVEKRSVVNRLALGGGVLHGLTVEPDGGDLLVQPGVALDYNGSEIVVPRPISVSSDELANVGPDAVVIVERRDKPDQPTATYADSYTAETREMYDLVREESRVEIIEVDTTRHSSLRCSHPWTEDPGDIWSALHEANEDRLSPQVPGRPTAVVLASVTPAGDVDNTVRRLIPASDLLLEIAMCHWWSLVELWERVGGIQTNLQEEQAAVLRYRAGDDQNGHPGHPLDRVLVVRSHAGGRDVTFRVRGGRQVGQVHDGAGWVREFTRPTDNEGYAATRWRLGRQEGLQSVEAFSGYGSTVEFRAIADEKEPKRQALLNELEALVNRGEDAFEHFIREGREHEREEEHED